MCAWSEERAEEALRAAARFGINPSLSTIRALCAALGDPQQALRVIQVGGTNGKGSTTRMTDALLRAHGHSSSAFVSPYLHAFREQFLVDGVPISRELFASAVETVFETATGLSDTLPEPPTQFELMTAAALWAFREAGAEWTVLEVGMGGRWDSTSVSEPVVSVIVSVGMDHVEYLGPTVEDIAADKAHIIRAGGVGVLGPGTAEVDSVFARRADEVGARLVRVREDDRASDAHFTIVSVPEDPDGQSPFRYDGPAGTLELALRGPAYQVGNAACALSAAALALGGPLRPELARSALADLRIDGRFEVLAREPWVVADVAHNAAGAAVLADAVRTSFGGQRPTVVLGMLSDKDARTVSATLAEIASRFIVARPDSPRGLDAALLAGHVERATGVGPEIASTIAQALTRALEDGGDVLVTGSVVTVAEARSFFGRSVLAR